MRDLAFPEIILLSLSFARPWMLLWLPAVAVPPLIHMLSRRRRRTVDWAATRLLQRALSDCGGRRAQVAERFLLGARCAVVALAVIALAEPVTDGGGGRMAAGRATHRVLVFDVSYSMAYRRDGQSHLERSKQWAREMVRQSPPETEYSLVAMGRRPVVITEGPRSDGTELMTAIDGLDVAHGSADVAATFKAIGRLLSGRGGLRQRHGPTDVFVFTDLGATSWDAMSPAPGTPPRGGGAGNVPAADLWEQLASVVLCDVGTAGFSNTAVNAVRMASGKAAIGQPVEFTAFLAHFGSDPADRQVAQWWIDGAPGPREAISFDTRDRVDVSLTHAFTQAGMHTVELRLDPDALTLDDYRLACVPVVERLHVLCVGGRDGATYYLLRALQPDVADRGPVAATDALPGTLLDHSLDAFDCIMLANVRRLRSEETRALRGFLDRGGGVICFMGDEVELECYNLWQDSDQTGQEPIVPARLNGIVRSDRNYIDPLDFQHPILRQFRGPGASALTTTPVFSHVRLDVDRSLGGTRVAAAFGNGDPAIVVAPMGQGTSIIVATAASLASVDAETGRPWTAMPAWPSFLPLVQELVKYSTLRQAERVNSLVGAPLTISAAPGVDVTVVAPDGDESTLTGNVPRPTRQFHATDRRGLYVVRHGRGNPQRFAVNLDTAESDLRRTNVASLPRGIEVRSRAESTEPSVARSGRVWQAYPALMGILLGLLLFESMLAVRLMTPYPRNSRL